MLARFNLDWFTCKLQIAWLVRFRALPKGWLHKCSFRHSQRYQTSKAYGSASSLFERVWRVCQLQWFHQTHRKIRWSATWSWKKEHSNANGISSSWREDKRKRSAWDYWKSLTKSQLSKRRPQWIRVSTTQVWIRRENNSRWFDLGYEQSKCRFRPWGYKIFLLLFFRWCSSVARWEPRRSKRLDCWNHVDSHNLIFNFGIKKLLLIAKKFIKHNH